MDQWEYLTCFIEANTQETAVTEYAAYTEEVDLPIYTPQSLMPELNRLGAKGWELVHMQPVFVGNNHDILMHEGGGSRRWSNTYFCVFKRPT